MFKSKRFFSIFWVMIPAFSFFSCQNRPVSVPPGFDWQGHRGSRGLMPENTTPAFLKALEYPEVTTLELDLAVSKDSQLIVSHEPWFNPSICLRPGGDSIGKNEAESLLIYRMTAAEIRDYDCGSIGNPRFPQQQKTKAYKPTLREVVEAVRAQRPDKAASIRWNVEIKSEPEWDEKRHPAVADFARLTVDEIRRLDIAARCTVQSFDKRALQAVHRAAPDIALALLVENTRGFDANIAELGFQPAIYSPYYLLVSKRLVRDCHDKNIKLIPWTVNDVPNMRKLIRLGVDGIITDYPDKIGGVQK
jgi:glycerophosphoryl diester phosphodiesterase